MKIGLSSTGKDMQSQVDPRFGRCAYFIIIQTDDMTFEVFENENNSIGGAGIHSARFLNEKGVQAVLTGNCGPNAMDVFNDCKIKVITGQTGLINGVIKNFKNNQLKDSTNTDDSTKDNDESNKFIPRAQSRCMGGSGQGQGRGRGNGRGMGRRMSNN